MKKETFYKRKYSRVIAALLAVGFVGGVVVNYELPVKAADTEVTTAKNDDDDYKPVPKYEFAKDEIGYEPVSVKVKLEKRTNFITSAEVTGKVKVPTNDSDGYYVYDYTGELGSTVNATLSEEDNAGLDLTRAPLVKIQIPVVVEIRDNKWGNVLNWDGNSVEGFSDYDAKNIKDENYVIQDPDLLMHFLSEPTIGNFYFGVDADEKPNDDTHYIQDSSTWIKQDSHLFSNLNEPTSMWNFADANYLKDDENDGRKVLSKDSVTQKVDIPAVEDGKSTTVTSTDAVSGKFGSEIDVPVPEISGYKADKTSVKATVTKGNDGGNGQITVNKNQIVNYTKIPTKPTKPTNNGSHSSSSSSSSDNELGYGYLNQTVSTYSNKGPAKLYSLSGKSFTPITNKALAPDTGWFTDQMITYNNKRYYRVATNEWVRSTEAYVYEDNPMSLNVEKQTSLINAEDEKITNRALGANTSWHVDRIAYLGDYQKPITAYRVATNEFVLKDK